MLNRVHHGISPDNTLINKIYRFLDDPAITSMTPAKVTGPDEGLIEVNLNLLDADFKFYIENAAPTEDGSGLLNFYFANMTGACGALTWPFQAQFHDLSLYLFSDESAEHSILTVAIVHHTPALGFDYRGFVSIMALPYLHEPTVPAAAFVVSSFGPPQWRDNENYADTAGTNAILGSLASFDVQPYPSISGPDEDDKLHIFTTWAAQRDILDGILKVPDYWIKLMGKQAPTEIAGQQEMVEAVPTSAGDVDFLVFKMGNVDATELPLNNAPRVTEYDTADHRPYDNFRVLVRLA